MTRSDLAVYLKDAAHSGAYRAASEAGLAEAAAAAGLGVARISLAPVRDKTALLERIAAALEFPRWFGTNWDALEDCLTDLSWRRPRAQLLLLEGFEPLRAAREDDFGVLLDILRSSAEHWAERGTPFFAVFVDPAGALALPELGAGAAP